VPSPSTVAIVRDTSDSVAHLPAVEWALEELQTALHRRGVDTVARTVPTAQSPGSAPCTRTVLVAGPNSGDAAGILANRRLAIPFEAEALVLATGTTAGLPVTLAAGADARGLVYALLELADRVQHASDPLAALDQPDPVIERPANSVRSVMRLFSSDVHDRPGSTTARGGQPT